MGLFRFSVAASCVAALSPVAASADVYTFGGYQVDIDATVGSGVNETILVIDWDTFGGPYVTPSHAFLYRWDGEETLGDLLRAFDAAGTLKVTAAQLTDDPATSVDETSALGFLNNLAYSDGDGDAHLHSNPFNWELASSFDPLAEWEGDSPGWDFNPVGFNEELLVSGQFEGINAAFFEFDVSTEELTRFGSPLTVPLVPEPVSAALLGTGALVCLRRRRSA